MPDDDRDDSAVRARSFGPAAAAYAAHRPGYPADAIGWALAGAPGRRVLDLGAGTGKLTAGLVGRAEVVAVEPDPDMLGELRSGLPGVEAIEGSAEDIPLPAASVDAVLVGQALHWFDTDRAFPEIARVLRPGGVLAGLWNADDSSVDWVRGYVEVLSTRPNPRGGDGARIDPPPPFGPVERETFANPLRTTVDSMVATLGTHSWALTSTDEERAAAFGRLRAYLAGRPEAVGEFDWPVVTLVLRTFRS